jgi:hypothetical protein
VRVKSANKINVGRPTFRSGVGVSCIASEEEELRGAKRDEKLGAQKRAPSFSAK